MRCYSSVTSENDGTIKTLKSHPDMKADDISSDPNISYIKIARLSSLF